MPSHLSENKAPFTPSCMHPLPLSMDSTIAVVAPSSPPERHVLEKGKAILENYGFKLLDHTQPCGKDIPLSFMNGSHEERLNILTRAFQDPQIDALWCARGGYGLLPLLPLMPLDVLKKYPKLVIGFSDSTSLLVHNFLYTGLVGLHGPLVTTLPDTHETDKEKLWDILTGAPFSPIEFQNEQIINPGHVRGRLLGGNLSTLVSLFGVLPLERLHDNILFIEDVNEPPYRLHRLLTQLKHSGFLSKCNGLLVGDFLGCNQEEIKEVIKDVTRGLNMPIVMGLPFGHGKRNIPLPIGLMTEVDTKKGCLIFLESLFGRDEA